MKSGTKLTNISNPSIMFSENVPLFIQNISLKPDQSLINTKIIKKKFKPFKIKFANSLICSGYFTTFAPL